MDATKPNDDATTSVEFEMNIIGTRVKARADVPIGKTLPDAILPILQGAAEMAVDVAVGQAVSEGKKVQCKMGCGACCRQLVGIPRMEARRLRRLVAELPPERRGEIV
ncbi:MAG: hypothetical protein ACRC1K_24760, partial [Planctomycetia bacterium]